MTIDEAIKRAEEVAEETQAVVDYSDYYGENVRKCEKYAKEHRQLAEWLKELKELRARTRWIPVSERTPKEPKENPLFENKKLELYLVTLGYEAYPFRAFWNGKFFTDGWAKCEPIAWMPLPEPYKAERSDTE